MTLNETDAAMLDEERDFYMGCGCWSGQQDHACRLSCTRCGGPE